MREPGDDTEVIEQEQIRDTGGQAVKVGSLMNGTPAVFQYSCPYCKRGFEYQGLAKFPPPPKMVCDGCHAAYEAKIVKTFELDDAGEFSARRVASLPKDKGRRKEILRRWNQLSQTKDIREKCRLKAMIEVVHKCDLGVIEPIARKEKGGEW